MTVTIPNLSVVSLEEFLNSKLDWDIFLCCSSFEDRCTRSSEILNEKRAKIGISVLHNFKERDRQDLRGANAKIIEKFLRPISGNFYSNLGESVSSPRDGVIQFLNYLEEKKICLKDKTIAVDITVFTKAFFFLFFKALRERYSVRNFSIIYTEPERYKKESETTREIILTEGFDRLESLPGYSGSSAKPKDALIVELGFEGKRALDVFYHTSPEITYAINGFPSYQPGWHKLSLEANMRFLTESKSFQHLYFAPALDPFETQRVIADIVQDIRKQNDFNIIISPLGTKIQAFGTMLYAMKDEDAKVVYPFPSFYKPDYSYKFGPSWIFEVILP